MHKVLDSMASNVSPLTVFHRPNSDAISVHGANGYIISQFLDSTSNKRTDEWGGSVENRARFALETLKAVKEVFGENVAIKFSPAGGYNDMG
jgi:2,4-dienoyl-CoA reductase-like NADH-dependent reductase (Old Yellow Enzyme family)